MGQYELSKLDYKVKKVTENTEQGIQELVTISADLIHM